MGIQVFQATHDGQGNPLPNINKQFISFTYGEKKIEDFGLIAVFSNDRLEKGMYADFADITSNNEGVDGQLYWSTYFNPGHLSFILATDGMTSIQYENFKNYFRPGEAKELVLSEFPNRAIMARVTAAPSISLLPFEGSTTFSIGGKTNIVKTSLYKGEIRLDFIMDDPYWYSKSSYINKTTGFTQDELKTILEDGIPSSNMFNSSFRCFLADNYYYNGSEIEINSGVDLNSGTPIYLYNCGTAKVNPKLSFSISTDFSGNNIYIGNATNKCALAVGNEIFSFTTPSLLTSYNTAIDLINNEGVQNNIDLLQLRAKVRDNLYNYYTRAWAMNIIDTCITNNENGVQNGALTNASTFKSYFNSQMRSFTPSILNIEIDCKTGISTMTANVKIIQSGSTSTKTITENAGDMITGKYLKLEGNTRYSSSGLISSAECLPVTSNCTLSNLKIEYKYSYL